MDAFGFLSVLLSIILGLAVTRILEGFRALVLMRGRVKSYWPVLAWAVLLLLICVQSWWAMFGMRNRQQWNFAGFSIVLLQVTILYMACGLVFPDFSDPESADLKKSYYAHSSWLGGFVVAMLAVSIAKDVVLDHKLPDPLNLGFHVVFAIALLIGATTKSELYHKCLVIFALLTFVAYVGLLFTQLQ